MVLVQQTSLQQQSVVTNGMYMAHKPQDHEQWLLNNEKVTNHRRGKNNSVNSSLATNKKPKSASTIKDSAASKLSHSKSLQDVLVSTAGFSESQFNKIWADACNALGNSMALNVGSRIKWISSFFLSYSQFRLPLLSYYSFGQSFLYTRPRHSFTSHFALLKSSTNGHASYHGLQFQVTPDIFGGRSFRSYLLYRLRYTVSFSMPMISDQNIAS
jgi:hypothetical protein